MFTSGKFKSEGTEKSWEFHMYIQIVFSNNQMYMIHDLLQDPLDNNQIMFEETQMPPLSL